MSDAVLEVTKKKLETRTRLNESGRLVLPKEIRDFLGAQPGDVLFFTEDGDGVRIETQKQKLRKIQAHIMSIVGPEISMVDELIAERREEFRKEMEE
jgi:AbrB family looped-hinge helix DNA binding protein